MGGAPFHIRHTHCKNGPRFWIKTTYTQMWMLPKIMSFDCGEVYRRIDFDWSRCAAEYERIAGVKP